MKRLTLLCLLLCGCASTYSILKEGHPNRTTISVPPGSTVIMLDGGAFMDVDNDGRVEIPRGAGPLRSNVGRVENDKGVMIGVVRGGVNPWVLGNFLPYNGVVVGFIVDFAGGGAFNPKFVPVKSDEEILKEIETSTEIKP